jgi:hypothetical protein
MTCSKINMVQDFPLHRVYSSVLSMNTGFISSQWYERKYFMDGGNNIEI